MEDDEFDDEINDLNNVNKESEEIEYFEYRRQIGEIMDKLSNDDIDLMIETLIQPNRFEDLNFNFVFLRSNGLEHVVKSKRKKKAIIEHLASIAINRHIAIEDDEYYLEAAQKLTEILINLDD
jgi:hypothetical protein